MSLYGLVGVIAAWYEGPEIKVLGLVTGIHVRDPAPKLPGRVPGKGSLRYVCSLRQKPWLLHEVPAGQAPSGLPLSSTAQSGGLEPSGGMHFFPSPGMLPGAGPEGMTQAESAQYPGDVQSLSVRHPA